MSIEKLTDTELHAYVDNELDAEQEQRITAAANKDVALKNQIDAIRALKASIAESFSTLQNDAVPPLMLETVTQPAPSRKHHWAAAACLVAGIAGGYLLGQQNSDEQQPTSQDWIAQVVNYQDMYTTDTLSHVQSSSEERDATLTRLTNALKHNLIIPEFADKTIEFKRGQILTSQQKPVIQLAFLDTSSGTPIALCITSHADSAKDLTNGNVHGMNYVNWSGNGLDFLVVGEFSHEQLQVLARDAREQFSGAV